MRKFVFFLFCLSFCLIQTLGAQDAGKKAPAKETVIVDLFSRVRSVSIEITEGVRNGVLQGFSEKGRFNVIDAATEASLKKLNEGRIVEDEVDKSNVMDEGSAAVMSSLGAKFIVSGSMTNYTASSTVNEKRERSYTVKIIFSLKVYEILSGKLIASKMISTSGLSAQEKNAALAAVKSVKGKMDAFVNEYFKFDTYILQLETVKRGKLKELYIHCGAGIGVTNGDTFVVLTERMIGPVKSLKEIGRLRVIAVEGEELAKCTVTDGNKQIANDFNSGQKIIVRSDRSSFAKEFLDGARDILFE